ncbi:hypothetical protein MMC30_009196 [Trapelia coarctata]|nr:hypothetical protein [Trapelia coarctata]
MPWPRIEPTLLATCALLALFALFTTQIALSSLLFLHSPKPPTRPHPQHPNPPSNAPTGTLGAVASENALCSEIGISLLRAGGNAADALVGMSACVGVVGMYHSGIGGGGFMLVRKGGKEGKGEYEVIDAREVAGEAAGEEMFQGFEGGSVKGGLASAVPGELRGLEYLHTHYGVLPWASVLAPAIKLARDGFPVSHDLLRYMQFSTTSYDFLTQDPVWAVDFAPNGTRVGIGDILTRKRYADTLATIAEKGAGVFYTGAMAEAMVRAVRKANGTMTVGDLEAYRVVRRRAVEVQYRGYKVVSCGAPASGAVVLSALKTVEGYEGFGEPGMLNLSTHRLDEAVRFAYGERASLGDPDFLEDAGGFEAGMLSAETAAKKRAKISDRHTLNVSDYNPDGFESPETHGTSHMVAADASGLAISFTSTINLIFGSQVMVPETGVIMNDQMNDFSIPRTKNEFGFVPSPSNYIRPGKRPLSSMTPVIVEQGGNGSLYYIVGAAGGSRIITSTLQNLWHVLDRNMSAPQAIAQPRFHDQLIPNVVSFEWADDPDDDGTSHPESAPRDNNYRSLEQRQPEGSAGGKWLSTRAESGIGTGKVEGYGNDTVAFMKGRGHDVRWVPPGYSSAQAVRRLWNGSWEAAGEVRQRDSAGLVL